MSRHPAYNIWAKPVGEYLGSALPTNKERGGWYDLASSSWQFGCSALAALGLAERTDWGALPLAKPIEPDMPPRWDDICVVVLAVLAQRREITYRRADGSVYTPPKGRGYMDWTIVYPEGQEPKTPAPNIAAGHGCGPAHILDDHLALLESLGLVANGAWTPDAEMVMWRKQPHAWDLNVIEDTRFDDGLAHCLETMPQDVVEAMSNLANITAEDVAAAVARQEAANADLIAQYPLQARFDRTVTCDQEFRGLVLIAENQMNDLFFNGWRLEDGWLTDTEKRRALPLFHDPLAIQMRRAAFTEMGLAFPLEVPQ
jgi:hypothetical protein